MNYLKIYRQRADKKLIEYRDAEDEITARKELVEWFAVEQLESYRNGQGKGKAVQTETEESGKSE